jgi:DNA-binding LacI/PurR family transcriptional regulator/beta-lactamase class A
MTVSRSFNRPHMVRPETRARVLEVAREMGYTPNEAARSLVYGRTNTVALILPDIRNPFFTNVARGVHDVANGYGYTVVLGNTDERGEEERRYVDALSARRVDGVILSTSGDDSAGLLQQRQIPFVLFDRAIPGVDVDLVAADVYDGGRKLVTHLAEQGYRDVAFVGGPGGISTLERRLAGCRDAAAETGVRLSVHLGRFDTASGEEIVSRLCSEGAVPEAIVAANNLVGVGALIALRRCGLRVPRRRRPGVLRRARARIPHRPLPYRHPRPRIRGRAHGHGDAPRADLRLRRALPHPHPPRRAHREALHPQGGSGLGRAFAASVTRRRASPPLLFRAPHPASPMATPLRALVPLLLLAALAPPRPLTAQAPALRRELEAVLRGYPGVVGVSFRNLATGESLSIRGDEPFPTASLIKLPVLVTLLDEVAKGRVRLDEPLSMIARDRVGGSGVLQFMDPGLRLTVRDAASLMIALSDNTATNLLLEKLDVPTVWAKMDSLGLPRTRVFRKVFAPVNSSPAPDSSAKYGLGVTTPDEIVRLLALLQAGRAVSPAMDSLALGMLKTNMDTGKMVRWLPENVTVAHKSGDIDHARNDCGILYTPAAPLALCVMTRENADTRYQVDNPAHLLIGRIARTVFQHYNPGVPLPPMPRW